MSCFSSEDINKYFSSKIYAAIALTVYAAVILFGGMETYGHKGEHDTADIDNKSDIGVVEQIGKKISLDARFFNDKGKEVILRDLITRPTLILPVFYTCSSVCNIMMANLARAVNDMPLKLGLDYSIIAVSFDSDDTPITAGKARDIYTAVITGNPPGEAWSFLTGDTKEILKFTGSAGFTFKKTGGRNYFHPNVLISLSEDGTIIRYLGGPNFLPFDIAMALTEAEKGTPSISVRKILSYCFAYEPESKTYTLRRVKIIAGGILLLMGVILIFILTRKKTPE